MKIKAVVHGAEEGGLWAGIPILLGCVSQDETLCEVLQNLHVVAVGYLSVDSTDILKVLLASSP